METEQAHRRARPVTAVVTMGLIAIAAVTMVIAFGQVAATDGAGRSDIGDGSPPRTLVDGSPVADVPENVTNAVDGPVLGAAVLDAVPDGLAGCGRDMAGEIVWDTPPRPETVLLTTDALHVSLVGTSTNFMMPAPERAAGEPQRWRLECMSQAPGTGNSGSTLGPADEGGGTWSTCCDEAGLGVAVARTSAPDHAAWALQDRGGWWLAYPVRDGSVTVTWATRDGTGSSWVLFVDADGLVLEETAVGA